MAVYAYVRVSTDRQANEGESLGQQERRIGGYAMMQGLAVDHVFVERGVSGSKPLVERPEGAKLLQAIQPGDIVITAKLDRMFRSALDALENVKRFKEGRVALHMIDLNGDVTGDGMSKMIFTILSAVAEAERDRIRERIRDVKRDQKTRARYLGGDVPFGYRLDDDGGLTPEKHEQMAIRTMREMRVNGASYRAIAGTIGKAGFKLSHMGVKRTLDAHEASTAS
jgi:DNA invertase Pin-like site-specific DNA recombinase